MEPTTFGYMGRRFSHLSPGQGAHCDIQTSPPPTRWSDASSPPRQCGGGLDPRRERRRERRPASVPPSGTSSRRSLPNVLLTRSRASPLPSEPQPWGWASSALPRHHGYGLAGRREFFGCTVISRGRCRVCGLSLLKTSLRGTCFCLWSVCLCPAKIPVPEPSFLM